MFKFIFVLFFLSCCALPVGFRSTYHQNFLFGKSDSVNKGKQQQTNTIAGKQSYGITKRDLPKKNYTPRRGRIRRLREVK
jgi:hypothetical protein